jgi:hypothetical protein
MFDSGGMSAAEVRSATVALAQCSTAMIDRERIDLISALEELKAAAAALQARVSVAFDDSQRRLQAARGVPPREQGRGVGAQLALARRESPHRGSRHLGLARALVREMPRTMAHLEAGRISEWRATLLCRETAMLTVEDRGEVDQRLGAELPSMSDLQLVRAARGLAATLDADSVARRAARAAQDRRVSLRPAPDTMTVLTGLLPVAQGVAAYAALDRHARERIAAGDARGRGQIMADTLVERVTGLATADAPAIEVQVVVPVQTVAGLRDEAAEVPGYGPISADTARSLIATSLAGGAPVSVRTMFATADCTQLVALESRRRLFPAGLARFLALRDKVCRTPWCDAPVRHSDHVRPAGRGGPTSATNGQGLCAACNQAKESPGWRAEVLADGLSPGSRHRVRLTTPTGHSYDSTAPPLLESRHAS